MSISVYNRLSTHIFSGGSNREDQEVASFVSPAETPCSETSSSAHDATDVSTASSISSERSEAERSDAGTVRRKFEFLKIVFTLVLI